MKSKMNNYFLKTLSVIMVLVLILAVFSSCSEKDPEEKATTPPTEDVQKPSDDESRVFTLNSLEPLSAEKQAEVEDAWKAKHTETILWRPYPMQGGAYPSSDRYYGTYNGCVVFFTHTNLTAIGKLELAGQTITHGNLFKIWIYSDGEFYQLTSANQYEWFTESELLKIVEYHNEYEAYVKEIRNNGKNT